MFFWNPEFIKWSWCGWIFQWKEGKLNKKHIVLYTQWQDEKMVKHFSFFINLNSWILEVSSSALGVLKYNLRYIKFFKILFEQDSVWTWQD